MGCKICTFKNPKATVTAVIIKDNKILLLKRGQEPFLSQWDLPGGFMQEGEVPEEALLRELKEELGLNKINLTFIKTLPDIYFWTDKEIPIISHFFLADISGEIKLNEENEEFQMADLKTINSSDIAFKSNQKMVSWFKENFTFDLERIKELIRQLDSSATLNEQSLYRALLNGFLAKKYEGEKLVGLGWIFKRQTMLRQQAVIEDMILDEKYRGRGYGKDLLLELISWAKKEGVNTIELTSNPQRIAANELYKKSGFILHPTNHYLYFIK